MSKNKEWLCALMSGGVQGQPERHYSNFQIIEAKDENEACKEYNEVNNCDYFYGECFGLADSEHSKGLIKMHGLEFPKEQTGFDNGVEWEVIK